MVPLLNPPSPSIKLPFDQPDVPVQDGHQVVTKGTPLEPFPFFREFTTSSLWVELNRSQVKTVATERSIIRSTLFCDNLLLVPHGAISTTVDSFLIKFLADQGLNLP